MPNDDRLVVERHVNSAGSLLDSNVLEHVAVDLKATFEAIAQGQLKVVPPALDGVRGQLISAFKRPEQAIATSNSQTAEAQTPVSAATPPQPSEKPPKGRLF